MSANYSDVEQALRDAMEQAGISPASRVSFQFDGKKHRYRIFDDKGNTQSGEYKIYMDDRPAGYFKSFRASHGQPYVPWAFARGGESLSLEDRRKYYEEAKARKRQQEKEEELTRGQAIKVAREMYASATPYSVTNPKDVKLNDYPTGKKLGGAPNARLLGNKLLLPVENERGEIMTLQRIFWDEKHKRFSKLFTKSAPAWGNFIPLHPEELPPPLGKTSPDDGAAEPMRGVEAVSGTGEISRRESKRVWLCEGWATGVTLLEATHETVVCAMNAGNLLPVGRKIRRMWPERELIGAPDWDAKTSGNPGMTAIFELQDELGVAVVPPPFESDEKGTDWNDYFVLHGMTATRKALADGLKAAYTVPDFQYRRRDKLFPHVNATKDTPKKTYENMYALLAFLGISTRYNIVTKSVEYDIPGQSFCSDNERNAADGYITSKCVEYGLPDTTWKSYIWTIATIDSHNPVGEWIRSRPWDGTPRLPDLLDTIAIPPNYPHDLKETLLTKWLLSAVAAVMSEGDFKCRGVLVLQGAQSIGKTTWFKRLIPQEYQAQWFGEGTTLNVDNKDSVKQAVSKWITELGELEGTFKRSDMNKLKGFVTLSQDELRLPYAGSESRFPRRTVFAATVNDKNFLQDDTGNTRWWVVETLRIDYQHRIDVQQLFAEIDENLYRRGVKWYLTPDEERQLERQNGDYSVMHPAEDLIARRLLWQEEKSFWSYRTITEVLIECGMDRPSQSDLRKATKIVQGITGQKEPKRSGRNGSRTYLLPRSDRRPSGEREDDLTE